MARKPIPGWNDAEVDGWLREFRGTAHQCLNALMPHLSGAEQNRAKARINYLIRKLKSEGLDFSVSRAPASAPLNIVELHPKPKTTRSQKNPTPPPAAPTPPKRTEGAPVVSVHVEDVASLSRTNALAWTINQAATKAREMPADKSAASYLKIITEAHAELERRLVMRRLLSEFDLPDPDLAEGWARNVVSERFIESLLAAKDEAAMREMIEERAALVRGAEAKRAGANGSDSRPRSRDQHQVYRAGPIDLAKFVETIT